MSGIAAILRFGEGAPLEPAALDRLTAGLGGDPPSHRAVLADGRLGLAARGLPGYQTGIVTRDAHGAEVGLAFHGLLLSPRDPAAGGPAEPMLEELLTRFLDRGPLAVEELRGEFAIAYWDGRTRALHVATDRIRVQPLFFARLPEALLVASRIRSIVGAAGRHRFTVDPVSVLDVVGSSMIATPRTIFREVEKVPPAHLLLCRDGLVHLEPYWDIDFTRAEATRRDRLVEDTRSALDEALRDRLRIDRDPDRLGAFLSGGIDSSTVAGLLTRLTGSPIRTVSVGFGEERFNELHYARVSARAFSTRFTEYFVTPRDALETLPRVVDAFDEPFANASAVPTFHCARVAREQGVAVLYAGDGGDELWAGNERYATNRLFEVYDRVPGFLRSLLVPAVRAAAATAPIPLMIKAKKYLRRAALPPAERVTSYGFWHVVRPEQLVAEDFLATAGRYRPSRMTIWHHEHAKARTELDRQLYLDLKVTIGDNDLFKVTRMCEEAGVAVRFPFLDERVVAVAARVPARLKMRGGELRTFFKEAYADLLPAEVRAKKKHGFGLPISIWLRTDPALHEAMRDLVVGDRALARGYFRKPMLEELLRRHAGDRTTFYGTILWNLMILELWHRRALDAAGP